MKTECEKKNCEKSLEYYYSFKLLVQGGQPPRDHSMGVPRNAERRIRRVSCYSAGVERCPPKSTTSSDGTSSRRLAVNLLPESLRDTKPRRLETWARRVVRLRGQGEISRFDQVIQGPPAQREAEPAPIVCSCGHGLPFPVYNRASSGQRVDIEIKCPGILTLIRLMSARASDLEKFVECDCAPFGNPAIEYTRCPGQERAQYLTSS
ncbi:hypothetical protein PIIN_00420 [Serendipita indica DSM 11827]|uniref:Uncharacterized protein n=1 Tax=Serendipita indica (strain DSM 11827) TaxID=1109443 RepID=G4T5X7_SERID|nr:hypothetical protein PIIN_00420 [Serendipita indica DSM 11827]